MSTSGKRKNYFKDHENTKRRLLKDASKERGCKAILCTSDVNKQRQVVRESLQILNHFADILYPSTSNKEKGQAMNDYVEKDKGESLDALIEKEKQALMDRSNDRFTPLETFVKGIVVFKINSDEIDPCKLVTAVMQKVRETKELDSRTLNRMVPLQITTYPSVENIKQYAAPIIKSFLEERGAKSNVPEESSETTEESKKDNAEGKKQSKIASSSEQPQQEEKKEGQKDDSEEEKNKKPAAKLEQGQEEGETKNKEVQLKWGVAYKKRNHTSFPKMDAINAIADLVGPNHPVNLTDQDFTVILEVFQSVCGISIVDNYQEFKKFNLRSLMKEEAA